MSFVTTEIQDAVAVLTDRPPESPQRSEPRGSCWRLKAAFEAIDQNTVRCVVARPAPVTRASLLALTSARCPP